MKTMKQALILGIFSAIIMLSQANTNPVFAQEEVVETETPIGVDNLATQSSIMGPVRINYELPYPGMLPDNPFYFLKAIRDGVVKMLINDDMTKARFSLENASKRMFAARLLVEKGKDELAVTTISKGNNYFVDALDAVNKAIKDDRKNPDIQPFLQEFKSATIKHQEITHDLEKMVDNKFAKQLNVEEKRMKEMEIIVEELLHPKRGK